MNTTMEPDAVNPGADVSTDMPAADDQQAAPAPEGQEGGENMGG